MKNKHREYNFNHENSDTLKACGIDSLEELVELGASVQEYFKDMTMEGMAENVLPDKVRVALVLGIIKDPVAMVLLSGVFNPKNKLGKKSELVETVFKSKLSDAILAATMGAVLENHNPVPSPEDMLSELLRALEA